MGMGMEGHQFRYKLSRWLYRQEPLPHGVKQVGFEELNVWLRRPILSTESQLGKRSDKPLRNV